MFRLTITIILAFAGFLASAADHPLAGSWKLNTAKSVGPVPACAQDGILNIRPEVFTGSPKPDSSRVPKSGECAAVYLFTPSSDGRTLTLTQPQKNPAFKSVFEKQK